MRGEVIVMRGKKEGASGVGVGEREREREEWVEGSVGGKV